MHTEISNLTQERDTLRSNETDQGKKGDLLTLQHACISSSDTRGRAGTPSLTVTSSQQTAIIRETYSGQSIFPPRPTNSNAGNTYPLAMGELHGMGTVIEQVKGKSQMEGEESYFCATYAWLFKPCTCMTHI